MNEELALLYWSSQTPVRLLFLFILTGYTYAFKPGGIAASSGWNYQKSVGDHLKNNLVFTFGFVEVVTWFWVRSIVHGLAGTMGAGYVGQVLTPKTQVYVSLREERHAIVNRQVERAKAEENML